MTIKSHQLPLKLRLILGYLYFIIFSTSIVGAVEVFGPAETVFAGFEKAPSGIDELIGRSIMAVTSIATIALAIWTTRLIHRRSSYAGIAFVLLNLVSYGLYTIMPSSEGFVSVSGAIGGVVVLAIDIAITLYLLTSKQAKQILTNK